MNFFVKALCASVIGLSVPACVDTSGATTSMEKALHYAKSREANGIVFELEIDLGRCNDLHPVLCVRVESSCIHQYATPFCIAST